MVAFGQGEPMVTGKAVGIIANGGSQSCCLGQRRGFGTEVARLRAAVFSIYARVRVARVLEHGVYATRVHAGIRYTRVACACACACLRTPNPFVPQKTRREKRRVS